MEEQVARGEEFEAKAEKKLKGWAIFGNKYEDAVELYEKAANCYKLSKSWDKAGATYINLARCHEKLESKHESAAAHVDAANCYKKTNTQEAVKCLSVAVSLFMEIGRLSIAAKHYKDIAEIYEQEEDLENSMENYEKAFELYQGEEVTSTGNQCRLKVAQFAAQCKQYPKAIEIFEAVARQSMDNNLLKYSVKGYLLNAGLCYICIGDVISVTNAVERYQEIDPSFAGSRESKLLTDLAAAMEEEDVDKFTDVVREFDSMTHLDQWKTTLLLCAKEQLKEKVDQVDFT